MHNSTGNKNDGLGFSNNNLATQTTSIPSKSLNNGNIFYNQHPTAKPINKNYLQMFIANSKAPSHIPLSDHSTSSVKDTTIPQRASLALDPSNTKSDNRLCGKGARKKYNDPQQRYARSKK